MTSLDTCIAAAATAALAGNGTYLRETPTDAGMDTSTGLPAPFIVCGDLTISSYVTAVGKEFDSTTATVYFGDVKPGAGDSPEAHAAAVLRMELLQHRFFTELLRLDYPGAGRKRTEMRDVYAAMLDGWGCQFTLTVPAAPLLFACLPGTGSPIPVAPVITNVTFTGDAVTAAPLVTAATFVAA